MEKYITNNKTTILTTCLDDSSQGSKTFKMDTAEEIVEEKMLTAQYTS